MVVPVVTDTSWLVVNAATMVNTGINLLGPFSDTMCLAPL